MTSITRPACLAGLALSVLLASSGQSLAARIVPTHADDVCPPDADPCVVDTRVIIRDGVSLDFGTRAVRVTGRGTLRFHGTNNLIRCGDFLVETPGRTSIRMRKGATRVAFATIDARRSCSDAPVPCGKDSDCVAGSCSVGDGRIDIDGDIRMSFAEDAGLSLEATGNLLLKGDITEAGVRYSQLDLDTYYGDIIVTGDAYFGSGEPLLWYVSGGNMRIEGNTTLRSDSDGVSSFIANSAGDILVTGDIDVSSGREGGTGGEIDLWAEGTLRIEGGTADRPQRFVANGSQGGFDYGGEGGLLWLTGGSVAVGPYVEMESRASSLRNFAGSILIDGDSGTIGFAGKILVTGRWANAVVETSGSIDLASTSVMTTVTNGDYTNDGVTIHSEEADVRIAGAILAQDGVNSATYPGLDVLGCNVSFAAGASILATQTNARALVRARESLSVEAGATLQGWSGGITMRYRQGTAAPVVAGAVSPSPTLVEDPALTSCGP